jgi:hypothetical protein
MIQPQILQKHRHERSMYGFWLPNAVETIRELANRGMLNQLVRWQAYTEIGMLFAKRKTNIHIAQPLLDARVVGLRITSTPAHHQMQQ